LLTDTVGFIQKLPTTLIAAFRATLEEIEEADLILHVIDVTHPRRLDQAGSVLEIISDIGLSEKPMVVVLNKCDKLADDYDPFIDGSLRDLMNMFESCVFSSGVTGAGRYELLRTIATCVEGSR